MFNLLLQGFSPSFSLERGGNGSANGCDSAAFYMLLDDLVVTQLFCKSLYAADHQAKDDDATNRKRKYQAPAHVVTSVVVSKADRQNSDIAKIESIDVGPGLLSRSKDTGTARQPDHEHHGLKNQIPLIVGQLKVLRVMTEEVPLHINHEQH